MSEQILGALDNAESYRNPVLLEAAKAVASLQCGAFGVSESEMLERLVQGCYPKMVKGYLEAQEIRQGIMQECRMMLTQGDWRGRRIEFFPEEGEILIQGPYDADLGAEVLRVDGHWCSANLRNRRCFVVPIDAAEPLLKGLQRWKQSYGQKRLQMDHARRVAQSTTFHSSR